LPNDVLVETEVEPIGRMDLEGIEVISMDEPVEAGGIVWQILSVEDMGTAITSADLVYEARIGKIIVMDFNVLNNTEEPRILFDLNIIDDRGRVFSICLPAVAILGTQEACALQDIIPGVEYNFYAPFDVAPDSEGLIIEVTDLQTPAQDKVYIDLGI
jgi:hypothetical protein